MRYGMVCGALVVAAFSAGCGSDGGSDGEPGPGFEPLLPPPERGLQLNMKTTVESGAEVEHCKFVQVPEGEDLWVHEAPVKYTPGSHHVLVFRTDYEEIPTETMSGEPMDFSGVFDCTEGLQAILRTGPVIAGSQNADGGGLLNFPENVAMKVEAGTWLIINAHYINTTAEALEPEMTINLETIAESEVETEGGLLFWYNIFIKAPGMSRSMARSRCSVPEDITLLNTQSHMHARGVGYAATLLPGGDVAAGQTFYENEYWEDVPVKTHEGGLQVSAGDTIDYYCEYENPEARDVFQGPRTTDEMCMYIGTYYPRVPQLDQCSASNGTPMIGMDWVGNGTKSCNESLDCAFDAITGAGLGGGGANGGGGGVMSEGVRELLRSVTGCVDQSDPAVSAELSAAVRCFFENGSAALTACSSQFDACRSM